MTQRVIESRNKREGRYADWRVTGGRPHRGLGWKIIRHERAGGHPHVRKAISLKGWERLAKGGCSL